jgi:hypothetical protein
MNWRPINAGHCPIQMIILREHKLLGQSITLNIDIILVHCLFIFNKEVFGQFKFLTQCTFHYPRAFVKEILETFFLCYSLSSFFREDFWLFAFKFLLCQAFWTQSTLLQQGLLSVS